MTDSFDSSDAFRHAKPLKYAHSVTLAEPLALEQGGRLPEVTVAYETYGTLSDRRDNAVLVCHALTGDSHVARHDEDDDPGWWDLVVGPGKPIDTDRWFVICPNLLGGCRGTTGPNSVNPQTGRRYATDFPVITVGDIVEVQRLLLDHLGITRLRAAVGGSLGGHNVMAWAVRHPERIAGAAVVAASPRLTSQALAFDVVGRNAILRDPLYHKGQYYDDGPGPMVGLAIARMLGHITYLSREAMTQKFGACRLHPRDVQTQFETKFSVGSYLAYQGDRFGERFDPNSYLTLTMAIDLFDLGEDKETLREAFRPATCRWLLLSFSSDWLFPPFQSQQMVDALIAENKPVSYCNVQSACGHDAFLLPDQLPIYGELLRAFLANLTPDDEERETTSARVQSPIPNPQSPAPNPSSLPDSKSIFHHHRLDYDTILELIPAGSSVLDLGCGTGELLARLRRRGHRRIMGVEWDEQAILACVCRGLNVVQADLNQGLPAFAAGQFDFVILSQTLQTVLDVPRVLTDMLRVGRRGIVSFPNIAFHRHRRQLAEEGRAPYGHALQEFHWYDTPNLRFLSLNDFGDFCRTHGFQLLEQVALDTSADARVETDPNLNADVAIAVLSR
ncbi:MAG: homoserine O-acetyltransferase [Pirellulales bacterium]|nr:homoserine O-acetyltransferase [Pirellulales bacterium]